MNFIKIIQFLVLVIVVLLILYGFQYWTLKPYCILSIEDPAIAQNRLSLWKYIYTKISPPHKTFIGKQSHTLYLYIDDPQGIATVRCTVNGKAKKLEVPPMIPQFHTDFSGYEEYGTHHYHIEVEDGKGRSASADAIVTLSPPY